MIDKNLIYAVVGASNNPKKFGYQVFKDLLEAGFKVIPINLREKEILGKKVYPTLSSYNQKINIVVFVIPPLIVQKILAEVLALKINKVYLQPGSESAEAIEFCQKHGIECVHDSCIMINRH